MADPLDDIFARRIEEATAGLIQASGTDYLVPGQTLSHYRIVERIGEGGMGVVYKAEDLRLGRSVALKLLLPGLGAAGSLKDMFEREARSASSLNHPSILTIHDFDEDGGRRFIVMEYLDGETLKSRMAQGPIPEDEAIGIALQAASALDAAHGAGIIHCDIKPANIFITKTGVVKVLDFGTARLRTSSETQTLGSSWGTLAYMPPEQARGETLDVRADIFALGVTLREMTGAQCSSALTRVIDRMVSPNREDRYETMKDVSVALTVVRQNAVSRPRRIALAAAALVISALLVWVAWPSHRPPVLAQGDSVLIGDFDNKTGDDHFNDMVRDAVALQIGQSPYINVMPNSRINAALKAMKRPAREKLSAAVAREVAQQAGAKVFLTGSIDATGSKFTIDSDAVEAQTGRIIVHRSVDVTGAKNVMTAISQEASMLRSELGEPIASIESSDVPLSQATTSSLEALQEFMAGQRQLEIGTESALKAIAFFKRAIELDPDFTVAYSRVATAYFNLHERELSEQFARQAYERRNHAGERERLAIQARYYVDVTGEISRAIDTYSQWTVRYPLDPSPHNSLMVRYEELGEFDKAVVEGEEAVRLNPETLLYRENLAVSNVKLNRFDRAAEVCQAAIRDHLDNVSIHRTLYTIAFVRDDAKGMQEQDDWLKGRSGDYQYVDQQAQQAGARGKVSEAREKYTTAMALAERQGLDDRAALMKARLAFVEFAAGNDVASRKLAQEAADSKPSRGTLAEIVFVMAMAGGSDAPEIMDRLKKEYPADEFINRLWTPLIDAIVRLHSGDAAGAVEKTRALEIYDIGDIAPMRPVYVRGLAYLAQGSGKEAGEAFQKIIDHPGISSISPMLALAYLGLARSSMLTGDSAKAGESFKKFFDLWKDADSDLPVLKQARQESLQISH